MGGGHRPDPTSPCVGPAHWCERGRGCAVGRGERPGAGTAGAGGAQGAGGGGVAAAPPRREVQPPPPGAGLLPRPHPHRPAHAPSSSERSATEAPPRTARGCGRGASAAFAPPPPPPSAALFPRGIPPPTPPGRRWAVCGRKHAQSTGLKPAARVNSAAVVGRRPIDEGCGGPGLLHVRSASRVAEKLLTPSRGAVAA